MSKIVHFPPVLDRLWEGPLETWRYLPSQIYSPARRTRMTRMPMETMMGEQKQSFPRALNGLGFVVETLS